MILFKFFLKFYMLAHTHKKKKKKLHMKHNNYY